ncbi:MAG TPA: glutathione S-transferase family protein [Burkholderiales bacterium]|nr:glutathione S-transferase family protein [Burkholderiales bacterium]
MALTLVIGNKAYSSWSLRPWILMTHCGIAFDEVRIPLHAADSNARIRSYSPAGRVPVLIDGAVTVWDTAAIFEYLAEQYPDRTLWPRDRQVRAQARSISAEMHSGFAALRSHMPMNVRHSLPGRGRTPEVLKEIERVVSIWTDCRTRHAAAGPFLCGNFSIADAMFAPVVTRFQTYQVELDGPAREYADSMLALPAMQRWYREALIEAEMIAEYEP